jgi:hypothetical protein
MAGGPLDEAAERLGVPAWGKLLIWACSIITVAGTSGFITLFLKLSHMNSAILTLASKQPAETKDLVNELLAQAKSDVTSGNLARAQKALSITPVLLANAKQRRTPANPYFFESSIKDLNALQADAHRALTVADSTKVLQGIHVLRITLAEYRSILQPVIRPPSGYIIVDVAALSRMPDADGFSIDASRGIAYDLSGVPPGAKALLPRNPPFRSGLEAENPQLPFFVMNGSQELDNLEWINVVFLNMNLSYRGGFTKLKNVKFINCTFDFSETASSDELATHIALNRMNFGS